VEVGIYRLYFDEFVNLLSYVSTYESIQRQLVYDNNFPRDVTKQ